MESERIYNILVTGGSGFIGWNFLNYIFNNNSLKYNVVVNLDAGDYSAINEMNLDTEKYKFYRGRIKDVSESIIENYNIDLIINFAAHTHVDNSIKGVYDFVSNNVLEMSVLMENARLIWSKKNIKGLFVQISTDEVFGSLEDQGFIPFNEYTLHHPNNPYSASKSAAEVMLRSFMHTYNFPSIITNCSNNYGFGQHNEKLIPKIIENCLNKKTIPIYGDGLQCRDWIYVDDHCEGIISAIKKGKIGNSYLFGGDKTISNLEITKKICSIVDKETNSLSPHESLIEFVTDRLGHDKTYLVDYTRSFIDLGWFPKTKLDFGLEKTVKWYLNKEK